VSTTRSPGGSSHGHRNLRLGVVVGVVVLLAILGTYYATETYGPTRAPAPAPVQNETKVIYHNTTVFQNTTHNETTPIYHNTTFWQNSTTYRNGTVYNVTTVYVNTTKVVMIPVVNVTGLVWSFNPTGGLAGKLSAELVAPTGPGFEHAYPLGTVMWIVVNVTNSASTNAHVTVTPSAPFVLADSQPSLPTLVPAGTTISLEISIGVPYAPGEYTIALNVGAS
jgi:hypothetical protein